jgi:hypothetical protein
MKNISDNIQLNTINKWEIIIHLYKGLKYVVLFTTAFFVTNVFGDYKWIAFIIICLIIFYFFLKEMYKIRFGFRAILERLFHIDYEITVDAQGINLKSKYLQKIYTWKDIQKIVPEIITDKAEYKTNIVTRDSRVIEIQDDEKWEKLEIIKTWSNIDIEIGKIFEHSSDSK